MTFQKEITLSPQPRGFHLITNIIVNELPQVSGIVHLFIKHTSASLTINENADPRVRRDFETHFNKWSQKPLLILSMFVKGQMI